MFRATVSLRLAIRFYFDISDYSGLREPQGEREEESFLFHPAAYTSSQGKIKGTKTILTQFLLLSIPHLLFPRTPALCSAPVLFLHQNNNNTERTYCYDCCDLLPSARGRNAAGIATWLRSFSAQGCSWLIYNLQNTLRFIFYELF